MQSAMTKSETRAPPGGPPAGPGPGPGPGPVGAGAAPQPLLPFQSSYTLAPLADSPNPAGSLTFRQIDTPLGRMSLHVQFISATSDCGLAATLVHERPTMCSCPLATGAAPAARAPASDPKSIPHAQASLCPWMTPRQPFQCTLTLATTVRSARARTAVWGPRTIVLDKDVPTAKYLAEFPMARGGLERDATVYEARIAIEPMSATDSVVACPNLYLATLDVPELSDCALVGATQTGEQVLVQVSKAILAGRSPYFKAMFSGNRVESKAEAGGAQQVTPEGTPIVDAMMGKVPLLAALIPCLIHLYCGWLPGSALPANADALAELMRKCAWNDAYMTRHAWSAVVELAEVWRLEAMCWAAKRAVVNCLERECDGHMYNMIYGSVMLGAGAGGVGNGHGDKVEPGRGGSSSIE